MSKKEDTNLEEEILELKKEMEINNSRFNLIKNTIAGILLCMLITLVLLTIGITEIWTILLLIVIVGLIILLYIL
jgi:hypothetical protein